MSGNIVIVLIIVVWLFVLAPLFLRGQKPIRRTKEAFEETRVIHEGGSSALPVRKRPLVTAADVRHRELREESEGIEVVDNEDVLIEDDESTRAVSNRLGGVFAQATKFVRRNDAPEVVEGEVVEDAPQAEQKAAEGTAGELEADELEDAASEYSDADDIDYFDYDDDDGETVYAYDDAYAGPADLLHPNADYEEAEPYEAADSSEYSDDESDELTEEDLEFAARRRGRGGFDPEHDAEVAEDRYRRRQHTLIGLGVFVLVTLVAAFIVGSWMWIAPAIAGVLAVAYLWVLRQQVRAEERLRERRIRQMRRARLGVRHASDVDMGIPARLRRPGAIVLEADDASPDFEYLETRHVSFDEEEIAEAPASRAKVVSLDHYEPRQAG